MRRALISSSNPPEQGSNDLDQQQLDDERVFGIVYDHFLVVAAEGPPEGMAMTMPLASEATSLRAISVVKP